MTQVTVLPPTFSYDDGEQRIVVEQRYTEAQALMRQGLISLIEAGGKLAEIRDLLRHNKAGGFEAWCASRELQLRAAYRLLDLHAAFGGTLTNLSRLNIGTSVAYLLAAPSVPEEARQEALDRAAQGERIGVKEARQIAQAHQPDCAPVWELERGVRRWLEQRAATPEAQLALLTALRNRTTAGLIALEELLTGGNLAAPRRKTDVRQALNNILEQLRQLTEQRAAQIRGQAAAPEDSAATELPAARAAAVKASIARWLAATYPPADQADAVRALNAHSAAGQAARADLLDSGFLPTFYQEVDLITTLRELAAESLAAVTTSQQGVPTAQQGVTGCRVICADSRQLLRHVALNSAHLVITSPPYNVGVNYNGYHDDLPAEDYLALLRTVFANCQQVLVPGGRLAVVVPFGASRSPWQPRAAQVTGLLTALGFGLRGQITWDKGTTGNRTTWGSFRLPTNPTLRDRTEAILVAHTADGRLAVPESTLQRDAKGTYSPFLPGELFLALTQDLWAIAPESAQRIGHPAPFPVELAERLIRLYGYPGCHVLDPFAGSGTVGVAARQLGCQATLLDIDAGYCRLAQARIQAG